MSMSTPFSTKKTHSSRKIDEFIPDDAIGYPEIVFEDLIDEKVIEAAVREAARKPPHG